MFLLAVFGSFGALSQNPSEDTLVEQTENRDRAPREGDLAPDFTLSSIDRKHAVTLSDFRGTKPVVLIFGSYT
ncbi:MAG: hypothetical protein AAF387_15875 [Pseudomonadota bacterium]